MFELEGGACSTHNILLLSGFQFFQIVGYFTDILSDFSGTPRKIPLPSQAFEDVRFPSVAGLILGGLLLEENQLWLFYLLRSCVPVVVVNFLTFPLHICFYSSLDCEHSHTDKQASEQT